MDFPCVAAFQTVSLSGCCALARGLQPPQHRLGGKAGAAPVGRAEGPPGRGWQGPVWVGLCPAVGAQRREVRCLWGALPCGRPCTPDRCLGPMGGSGLSRGRSRSPTWLGTGSPAWAQSVPGGHGQSRVDMGSLWQAQSVPGRHGQFLVGTGSPRWVRAVPVRHGQPHAGTGERLR